MECTGGDLMDFTQMVLIVIGCLLFSIGFFAGRDFQYRLMMRRFAEVAEEIKPCCGNCKEYNGDYCTKFWNNLDECYKDTERDARDPEDEACDDWELDEDWIE
jgi:hypothetical protein